MSDKVHVTAYGVLRWLEQAENRLLMSNTGPYYFRDRAACNGINYGFRPPYVFIANDKGLIGLKQVTCEDCKVILDVMLERGPVLKFMEDMWKVNNVNKD